MTPQEKIRVLIVDDIAETRENIRRLLQFDTSIEVVGIARSGHEAIDLSQQIKPDVIIMDINMPDMDGITATEAIRRKIPYAQVVILSVQSDLSYMRRAMLVGARDFLTKPPSIDELTAAIHRAGAMAHEEHSKINVGFPSGTSPMGVVAPNVANQLGKIIVLYSPKGGTGVTTIATNLSIVLKTSENRVVLVDGNLQFGDTAVFINEPIKNNVLDLTSRVEELDPEVVDEVIIDHKATGIHVLAAPPRPEWADKITADQFAKLLQYLRQLYNYVVVDTASYLTDVVQAALEISDLIILITTQDIPSIKNSNAFLTLADASGIPRERIVFIMNRFDKRISISPERVADSLHQEVVTSIPVDERIVSNAANRGIPFMVDNKTQPISKTILNLAEIVKERLAKLDEAEVEQLRKK
ncbi:MAG: response regulator/pilus assembly protein [Chloroflexi bacterium]|jgi:pilus assembly protein CpaE|nr:response regulator [Anaerolineaceae bacterium]NMB87665.1 response regulator/pilus assembly protein [Chloroflexota bacterium]